MSVQFRQTLLVVLIVVMCPVLTLVHERALAQPQPPAAPGQAAQPEDKTGEQALRRLDEVIDSIPGMSEQAKAELRETLKAEVGEAVADPAFVAGLEVAADKVAGAAPGASEFHPGMLIPLAGILFAAFAVSVPVLIVIVVLVFAQKKRRQRAELVARFIESGQEVPRELLVDHAEPADMGGEPNLRRGVLLMGIGLGLLIALGVLAGWQIGALGLIPFFIGLARVVIWKLEGGSVARQADESPAK